MSARSSEAIQILPQSRPTPTCAFSWLPDTHTGTTQNRTQHSRNKASNRQAKQHATTHNHKSGCGASKVRRKPDEAAPRCGPTLPKKGGGG